MIWGDQELKIFQEFLWLKSEITKKKGAGPIHENVGEESSNVKNHETAYANNPTSHSLQFIAFAGLSR